MPAPTVFISYSHADEDWKDRLVKHLGVLQHQGLLRTWHDGDIGAGDEWFLEIQKAMDEAKVAVFLVSANSLTSKFILHTEMPHAIARGIGDRQGEANTSWNLGLAIEKEGDLARAAGLMQVCVDYEREIGHPDAEKDARRGYRPSRPHRRTGSLKFLACASPLL